MRPPALDPALAPIRARCPGCGTCLAEAVNGRGDLIELADCGDPAATAELERIRAGLLDGHAAACPGPGPEWAAGPPAAAWTAGPPRAAPHR